MHPLDFLRRKLTRGLEVAASEEEVRRGEEVDALVTISSLRGLEDVEVGLVCTEYYKAPVSSGTDDPSVATYDAIAYETWAPVDAALGGHGVRFTIPREAPFSYHGMSALSFEWEVVVRGHRSRGLDARASRKFRVLP